MGPGADKQKYESQKFLVNGWESITPSQARFPISFPTNFRLKLIAILCSIPIPSKALETVLPKPSESLQEVVDNNNPLPSSENTTPISDAPPPKPIEVSQSSIQEYSHEISSEEKTVASELISNPLLPIVSDSEVLKPVSTTENPPKDSQDVGEVSETAFSGSTNPIQAK